MKFATSPNNTTPLMAVKSLPIVDHMPRRRKRHFNKMSLTLLILVGCCSAVILGPVLAQAKESSNSNATFKGENKLNTDLQSHQHVDNVLAEGEANIKADKTNDKNTFKRLKPTDFNDDWQKEEEEDEKEDLEVEEHSSEIIEMIQPTHTLRHQEHYKQRIRMVEKDLEEKEKHLPQQQLDLNNDDDYIDEDYDGDEGEDINDKAQERELSLHNRHLRYQQIQLALREPITSPTPPHHHHRHEHHLAKQRWQNKH